MAIPNRPVASTDIRDELGGEVIGLTDDDVITLAGLTPPPQAITQLDLEGKSDVPPVDIPGEIIFDGIMTVGTGQTVYGYSRNITGIPNMGGLTPSTTIYGEDISGITSTANVSTVAVQMLNRRGMSTKVLYLNLYSPEGTTHSLTSHYSAASWVSGYWTWVLSLPANTIRPVGSKWRVVMGMDK